MKSPAKRSSAALLKAMGKALDRPGFVPEIYGSIGWRVRFLREAKGMTQEKLAKLVGLRRTSITNFESGKQAIPLHTMIQLAVALDARPLSLLKGLVE
jgi:DNA-binding XRE family transcriptional regulator